MDIGVPATRASERRQRDDARHDDRDLAVRRVRRPRRVRPVRGAHRRRARDALRDGRAGRPCLRHGARDRARRRARRSRTCCWSPAADGTTATAAGAYPRRGAGRSPQALRRRHAAGRRIGSVCTGAMLLAEAGLLERPPRDHAPQRDRGPEAASAPTSQDGARVVDDGDIITAAGVTSGIDMALHLVAQASSARTPPRRRGRRDRVELRSARASASGRSIGTNA